jgi:hypothetical protein
MSTSTANSTELYAVTFESLKLMSIQGVLVRVFVDGREYESGIYAASGGVAVCQLPQGRHTVKFKVGSFYVNMKFTIDVNGEGKVVLKQKLYPILGALIQKVFKIVRTEGNVTVVK